MKNAFTIFFTFICENELRREYINIAFNTLFENCKEIEIPILVIDGSKKKYVNENKKIFNDASNLTYIHDEDENPFKRCNKYFNLIKTNYILRLLEDCAFINFSKNDFIAIKKDIKFLENHPNIDTINYPVVDDTKYSFEKNILNYHPISFERIDINYLEGRPYFKNNYHYLCNNVLYRKELILKQWEYLAKNYRTHNDAEAGRINKRLFKIPLRIKYIRGVLIRLIRIYEKIFKKDYISKETYVLDTSLNCDAIHIGYYRVEMDHEKYFKNGNLIELKNLSFFNDISILKNITFVRK